MARAFDPLGDPFMHTRATDRGADMIIVMLSAMLSAPVRYAAEPQVSGSRR
ncbi:hypothetical protein [Mycobacterium sp. GA-1199]|uniref:hypothetical protein n=1 Tax=Mycobacterium sp. GA-1199 TaxID=1772287 RepID=UPI000B046696|nr:hypothetical protein [Mycobacterium sp. GA-1199]